MTSDRMSMSYFTPSKKLNKDTDSKARPNLLKKSLSEYYLDRFDVKAEPYKDDFKKVFYAPASEFLEVRHELACLETQLVTARVEWRNERKALKKRWERAIEKNRLVEESIPKFNGYYRDNFAKRERSIHQQDREREQIIVKERELRRLRKEKERLVKIKTEQDSRLDKFSLCKTYLDTVKQSSQGIFGDLRELMDRFGVLADARNALLNRTEYISDTVQRRQNALEMDILTKSNEVLAYRNFLSELMDYQSSLHEQVVRLEENLKRTKVTAAKRTLIIGQIKMSIRNLYMQVCRHMHRNPRISPEDTLGQLFDIKISVREMTILAKDIKRMLRQAFLTAEAETRAREKQNQKDLERQRKLDKLLKKGTMSPRELFGLKRRESVQEVKAKITELAITQAATAQVIPNATVDKIHLEELK